MFDFQTPRNTFTRGTNHAGKFRGGKLVPLTAVPFEQSESGTVSQTVTLALDPIAGNMITQIGVDLVCVYVPNLAIHALDHPGMELADAADLYRARLLDGEIMSGMEVEGEISRRMNIKPRSVGGQKMVRRSVRLAYQCAWNYLARMVHRDARQYDEVGYGLLPALYSSTSLDLLRGVLDPDDRINGQVNLEFTNVELPVKGVGTSGWYGTPASFRETGGVDRGAEQLGTMQTGDGQGGRQIRVEEDPDNPGYPYIRALLDGAAQGISLDDLWRAERADQITRVLDDAMRDDPIYGQELAKRMAYGVRMNMGAQPRIVYRAEETFGQPVVQRATDGPSMDGEVRSHMTYRKSFSAVIPATEFGGVLITMVAVKPDETLGQQPDPVFGEPLKRIDYIPEEMTLDPRKVYVRDLDADCDQADEDTVVMYTGLNQLRRNYSVHGLDRRVNPNTVANKNAMWQIELPLSVTPDDVAYPENVDHYPFVDNAATAEPVNYHIQAIATINTPRQVGPTPVENIDVLTNEEFNPVEEE